MSALISGVTGLFSLHSNATYGRLALVKSCLLLGRADVNGVYTELGTTPIHAAAYNGHLPVVKYLYEVWNANTIRLSVDGWTSLHCAAMNGYLPVVKYLIEEAKVRTTIESNDGWTCLHCAAANGFLPVVRYLIEKQGMDVDFTTYNGWTPLHWACCNGYLNVVKYLLGPGKANPLVKINCGSTILHCAARQGHTAVVLYLLSEDAPATESSSTASTADSSEPFPIEKGLNLPTPFITAVNDSNMDAFTIACLKGKLGVVEAIASRLGRDSFTQAQLQRGHDLHQAAAKQDKLFINLQLLKYLREWMQELAYRDRLEEEKVEVLTMRDVLQRADQQRTQFAQVSSSAHPTILTASALATDSIAEEVASEEDEDEDEDDFDEDDVHPVAAALSSPPTLDNAHLARSDLSMAVAQQGMSTTTTTS